ncbi:TldD/PmbA family protein [Alkaliphilus pronyensis]|uniref:TldD/PmbA family protein n=1 Tax=Alkaliphilus pronyensis TaxID=1482732 RepID=A0A6I0FC64_9FIRM|nr:TldD/PmbA family protein [Alkaliphilus pronyensis]KAB3535330.1 TldD/PmbA family protein [Alkaliphilus pronyensis]
MLNERLIENIITEALSTGGDFAEVFVEDKDTTSIKLLGGKVESTISGRDYGIGIRIINGFNSIYAYTNKTDAESLMKIASEAAKAIKENPKNIALNFMNETYNSIHNITKYPKNIGLSNKISVMREASDAAKKYSKEITQVTVGYLDEDQKILVANSEGKFVEDRRVRSRILIEAVAANSNEMQTGYFAPGAHKGFELFEEINVKEYAREAARIAVTMLNADLCPSGKFPVVIDNKFGGVIFHEACGHGLEATFIAKKNSVFADKIGEKVASDIVTAIDDGTIPNHWGSINIDDEGEKTRKNILIENGILKGYMIDKLNGRRMGMESTGSGRRQSYKYAPTSRMTNTYIAAGKSTPEEIIGNTENGIYAKYMGGGSVNPATGDFNFAVMEGYLIKKGKIDRPIRGATLIGNGPNILHKIDMVGTNLDYGQGMCGSVSGLIPANVGQPMIRVSEITVGGRKGE